MKSSLAKEEKERNLEGEIERVTSLGFGQPPGGSDPRAPNFTATALATVWHKSNAIET